jgi:hypothetical protein
MAGPGETPTPVSNDEPQQNFVQELPFSLTIPPVEVRWVNALTLGEYEIWMLVASLAFSAAAGFLVAYFQSGHTFHVAKNIVLKEAHDGTFLVVALIFVILFAVFLGRGLWLRREIWSNAPTYKMTAR